MSDQMAEMVHDVEPWVRPSVDLVLDEYGGLPELTWSLLHADPESGAFLRQPNTGQVALIDWTATTYGPVLYDVASAVMYLGGRHNADAFWDAYVSHNPAPVGELTEHLGTFTRHRAAVQAAYFSMRIGTQDRTGIDEDGQELERAPRRPADATRKRRRDRHPSAITRRHQLDRALDLVMVMAEKPTVQCERHRPRRLHEHLTRRDQRARLGSTVQLEGRPAPQQRLDRPQVQEGA